MRRLLVIFATAAAFGWALPAVSEDFIVRDVWFDGVDGGYAVRANLEVNNVDRLDGLLRGGYNVPLRFELHFRQQRDWLPDRFVGDIVWRGVLSYNAFLRRYALRVGDNRRLYATIDDAVHRVLRLRGAASDTPGYVKIFQQDKIYIEARLLMELADFPDPIRIALLLDDDWNTTGFWRNFPLRVER